MKINSLKELSKFAQNLLHAVEVGFPDDIKHLLK